MGISSTLKDVVRSMGSKTIKDGDKDEGMTNRDQERELLDLVRNLKEEAANYLEASGDGEKSIRREWEDNANRFVGNYNLGMGNSGVIATSRSENFRVISGNAINSGRLGLKRAYLMRTQNSVMANTANATASPIQGRIEPVEFGEEDIWYLTPRGGRIVSGAIKSMTDQKTAELEAAISVSADAAEQDINNQQAAIDADDLTEKLQGVEGEVRSQFGNLEIDQLEGEDGPSMPIKEEQYDVLMEMVANGLLPLRDTDITAITDKFIAQRLQEVCDVKTDAADMGIYWLMCELQSNIFGHQCGSFEWQTSGQFKDGFIFDLEHPMNVFTDPCHWDMRRRGYHIEENVVPVDKLIGQWPDFKGNLIAAAREGQQSSDDGTSLGGLSEGVDFRRQMVTITTAWIRDQLVPLSPEEALSEGLVVEEQAFIDDESQEPAYDDKTGEPVMRYFLPDGGEEVRPQDDVGHGTGWPDGQGIRQVVLCRDGQFVMQDIRCPYPDIPRVWNINIPRPDGSPYGQGEPVRLKHIDEIINYTLSMLVNYLGSLGFPTCIWPKTLMAQMQKAGVGMNLRPNMHIPVPDDKWMMMMRAGGFDSVRFKQTPLPPSYADFLRQMLDEHDTMSGNVGVRQGRAPSANSSGKLISELRQGAESSLSIKSRFLEQAVVSFYRLLIYSVTNWMPESEWGKILNRYKAPVIREIIRRSRLPEWNVTVKVSSGGATNDNYEQDRALNLYDRHLIGGEDALVKLQDDDPVGTARKAKEYWSPGATNDQGDVAQPVDPNLN